MFLDQLLTSPPWGWSGSPTGCQKPLSGTGVRPCPQQSTDSLQHVHFLENNSELSPEDPSPSIAPCWMRLCGPNPIAHMEMCFLTSFFFLLQTVSPLTVLDTSRCHQPRGENRASSWTSTGDFPRHLLVALANCCTSRQGRTLWLRHGPFIPFTK